MTNVRRCIAAMGVRLANAGLAIALTFVVASGAVLLAREVAPPGVLAAIVLACVAFLLFSYSVFMTQSSARRQAERKLADLADRFPGVLFRFRQRRRGKSRYEFVSRDVGELLGIDRASVLRDPRTLLEAVVDEDRPALVQAIRRAAREHGHSQHDFRVRVDGLVHWIRSSAALRVDPDGSVVWNGYWADVTGQKVAEEERDSFFTMSLDLLCTIGHNGHFKRANPAFTQALGWSNEELLGRPFVEFLHPDDAARSLEAYEQQKAHGGAIQHFENRFLHKDGSWRVLSWQSAAQPGGTLYASARDVTEQDRYRTELLRAMEEAEAASRAKDAFLATMSHEIRTPLNGVLGMLELLSLTQLDAEQRSTVAVVRQSGESLKRIIDDILEFSKIEAGRLDIHAEPASISDVVGVVRSVYAGLASSRGLLLEHSVDPRISPALRFDAMRLQQILNNLVSNALKFTPAGKVAIEARLVERVAGVDRVALTVTDTGIGVPPERLETLFQPFVQAESHTARRFGGTGLGLTISRRLAELMGGTIDMRSESGKGTAVTVTLPLPVADSRDVPVMVQLPGAQRMVIPPADRTAPPREQAEAQGRLILVVDDHETNRRLLVRQLGVLGYAADSAEDGAKALELWQRNRYGLALVDCNMPVMDGYELTRRIREIEAARGLERTTLIACTANAMRGEAEHCLTAGMDGYLAKPVQLPELQKKVGAWLPLDEPANPGALPVAGAGARAADAQAPLDRSVLALVSGGDEGFERDILLDFQRINAADARALEAALESKDLPAAQGIFHRMKGASRMIGAGIFAAACERLELAAGSADWTALEAALPALRFELQQLHAYIGRR
jgi:PAS domain S-box-containing protein